MAKKKHHKQGEMTTFGNKDNIIIDLPFKPVWCLAEFVDEEDDLNPSCAPLIEDICKADIVNPTKPGRGGAIMVSYQVKRKRKIRWLASTSY